MKKSKNPSRRAVLRGAGGIALALPFMDCLAPRSAHAQQQIVPRFVPIYFPCGASPYWRPAGTGAGGAWTLSPILAPLAPFKNRLTVLSNVDNAGPFAGGVTPAQAVLSAAFLNCAPPVLSTPPLRSAVSADQVAAQKIGQSSPVRSLQLGLATHTASGDGLPAALSRTISWSPDGLPLQRVIDPQAVFDRLVGVTPDRTDRPQRPFGAADRSVLDYVMTDATALRPRLGRTDRLRLDAFLASVRDVEKQVDAVAAQAACRLPARPQQGYQIDRLPADYNRDKHADVMIDLMVLAMQCQLTQVISLMLDDPPSSYPYSFLPRRDFRLAGAPQTGTNISGDLQGLSTVGADVSDWSTVTRWMMEKVARLCTKLMAIPEGSGATVLDNTLVWVGSEMNGGARAPLDLPLFYLGNGGGRLRVDEHIVFPDRCRLSDLYRTLLGAAFVSPVSTFGDSSGIIARILP